jgi:hypothetical protein
MLTVTIDARPIAPVADAYAQASIAAPIAIARALNWTGNKARKQGRLVGRGGNQSDMVCDEVFDPSGVSAFTWPTDYPAPMQVGFAALPIITPAPKAKRDLALPPPTQLELPAKGVVPAPKGAKGIITKGVPAGGAVGGIGFWDWIAAHPWETAGLAFVGAAAVGGAVYALNRWQLSRHETPIAGLVPVAA